MKSLANKYKGNIHIGEFSNHEKMLIKDSDYVVYGSNNWLANKSFKNSEHSSVIHSSELSEKEFARISKLIIENEI